MDRLYELLTTVKHAACCDATPTLQRGSFVKHRPPRDDDEDGDNDVDVVRGAGEGNVMPTRSIVITKRTARRSCLVDLLHCQHCFLRHMR